MRRNGRDLDIHVIGLGLPDQPPLQHLQQLFQGDKLSLGFARTPQEISDSLRPVAAKFDVYRKVEDLRRRAEVSNLVATLAESNAQQQLAAKALNQCRFELAKEQEAGKGCQQSVENLNAELTKLNQKFQNQAKQDAETILQQMNLAATRKQEIDKLKNEICDLVV
jgi:hypothetical protein